VNASERIAIGDPVSRRFTLTATGHLNDSEVIQELTTCVVLYLQDLFPKLFEAKVKAGIFVGPQIKKIIECDEFAKLLNRKEKTAWNSLVAAVHGFL